MAHYSDAEIAKELSITFKGGRYNNRTTFASDFDIANKFGIAAVKDTFNRAFKEWKDDIVYLTELTIVMNEYCWYFHDDKHSDKELSELYSDYYYKCYDYAYRDGKNGSDEFTDDERYYYHRCAN